jgi:formylglycine-generating enzyme required for sulfatase activity
MEFVLVPAGEFFTGSEKGEQRVLCSGCYWNALGGRSLRHRDWDDPHYRSGNIGFRLVVRP